VGHEAAGLGRLEPDAVLVCRDERVALQLLDVGHDLMDGWGWWQCQRWQRCVVIVQPDAILISFQLALQLLGGSST
jgi:hypothetical protein